MKRPLALLALLIPMTASPAVASAIDVSAKSAIVIDAASGKVLWAKDADTPRYPASTTKVMTGLLLVEKCLPNEIIVAPPDIEKTREASMHLKPGEKVSAHDMLYAMMLRSANDGCVAVADHISGSVPAFTRLMNERAREIGCTGTHFDNPNGLNDPLHYTTAHDLARIARVAMKYPPFEEVVRTQKYRISRSINWKDTWMVNHDRWLKKDATADGIKTGWTIPAGHCFVGSATRNGFRVITVIMKSDHWQLDHEALLDWAYSHYKYQPLLPKDAPVGDAAVAGGDKAAVPIGPTEAVSTLLTDACAVGKPQVTVKTNGPLRAPIRKGQIVGMVAVRDAEGFTQEVPVAALEDVGSPAAAKAATGSKNGTLWIGGALFVGVFWMRSKARRRIRSYGKISARQRTY